MPLSQDLQQSYVGEVVTLFQLDCTMFDGGSILYFTSTAEATTEITFGGNTYTPVEIEAEGFEYNGNSAFPNPVLRLSNVTNFASSIVIAYQDLIGAKVYRIRTLKQYLDDGDSPDTGQIFSPDMFVVEQKTKHTKSMIEWKLSASIDQQGLQIPGLTLVRDYCARVYRTYNSTESAFNYNHATCPYVGSSYFTAANASTTDASQDRCQKTLGACKLRFGANSELPFKACPGLGRFR